MRWSSFSSLQLPFLGRAYREDMTNTQHSHQLTQHTRHVTHGKESGDLYHHSSDLTLFNAKPNCQTLEFHHHPMFSIAFQCFWVNSGTKTTFWRGSQLWICGKTSKDVGFRTSKTNFRGPTDLHNFNHPSTLRPFSLVAQERCRVPGVDEQIWDPTAGKVLLEPLKIPWLIDCYRGLYYLVYWGLW